MQVLIWQYWQVLSRTHRYSWTVQIHFFQKTRSSTVKKTKQMQVFSRRQISELSKRESRCKYFLEDRIFICTKCRADASTFYRMQNLYLSKIQSRHFLQNTESSFVNNTEQMKVLSRRQSPEHQEQKWERSMSRAFHCPNRINHVTRSTDIRDKTYR